MSSGFFAANVTKATSKQIADSRANIGNGKYTLGQQKGKHDPIAHTTSITSNMMAKIIIANTAFSYGRRF